MQQRASPSCTDTPNLMRCCREGRSRAGRPADGNAWSGTGGACAGICAPKKPSREACGPRERLARQHRCIGALYQLRSICCSLRARAFDEQEIYHLDPQPWPGQARPGQQKFIQMWILTVSTHQKLRKNGASTYCSDLFGGNVLAPSH